jgi:hypothetical protein
MRRLNKANNSRKRIFVNPASICAINIVSLFVLFLTASQPHRVHHLFDNRPLAGEVPEAWKGESGGDYARSSTAINQIVDAGDHSRRARHKAKNLASDNYQNQDHRDHSHHEVSSHHSNHLHDHSERYHDRAQYRTGYASCHHEHTRASGVPLNANTPNDDARHDNSSQTICLLHNAAQHSHISTAHLLEISFLGFESQPRADPPFLSLSTFNLSPFSQRAPPKV